MQVKNLHIERRESWDTEYPKELVGIVQLSGPHGKIEVKLSNETVANIFGLIKKDVERASKYNANQVGHAVDEAQAETKLIEAQSF